MVMDAVKVVICEIIHYKDTEKKDDGIRIQQATFY